MIEGWAGGPLKPGFGLSGAVLSLNRLHTLTYNGQTPNFVFGYDALSRRNSLARPNGVNTTYGYDPVSRLLGAVHKLGTTVLDGVVYTYDNAGNRSTRTDKRTNVTLTYGYDHIYQLQTAKQGTTTNESYTYDLVGNRLSSKNVPLYSYNPSNELTSTTPGGNYTYDSNGNEKSKPDGTTYFWDSENRLTQVILPGSGGTVNFKYDPFGRRIQKASATSTTDYLYDGANILETLSASGSVLARYTDSLSIDEPLSQLVSGTTNYYEQDGLGSVTSLTNSAGARGNTYTYDSYGVPAVTGTTANPFQFTGREFDPETGIYYYRARYYDHNIGRFLSEDPSGFSDGTNFYPYVKNSPVGNVDPLGLARCTFYVSMGWLWCVPDNPADDGVSINVASGNNGGVMPCKNNSGCDPLSNRGPIPRGWWIWTTDPTSKPNGRVLAPMPGTITWGRTLFRSHSCKNAFGPSVSSPFCSEGCVTGSPNDIRQLNRLLDSEPGSTVQVVE